MDNKKIFIVFKKQPQEVQHAYSLVDEEILKGIPQDTILAKKEVPQKLYTSQEFEQMRDELVKENE